MSARTAWLRASSVCRGALRENCASWCQISETQRRSSILLPCHIVWSTFSKIYNWLRCENFKILQFYYLVRNNLRITDCDAMKSCHNYTLLKTNRYYDWGQLFWSQIIHDFIIPKDLINFDFAMAFSFVSASIQVLLLIWASNDLWILLMMFKTSLIMSLFPSMPFSLT